MMVIGGAMFDQLDIVKSVMSRNHLTMADVSRFYGIPYRTLQDWFSGRRHPPGYVLVLLGDALMWRYGE